METLYRKYRPIDFDSVVGQDAVVKTLKNQIASGNIAHAYLFSGTYGTGKTTVAKIFARAVNCPNEIGGNPCNACDICKSALNDADYNIIELDAASNGNVEKVRQITDSMQYSPINDEKYKVYIIDEAHALSGFSKEAFLKSLEEPPEYVIYILATTDPNKLPETILSRCQKFSFRRISIDDITSYLKNICDKEGILIDEEALTFIAEKSDGSMRESISKLDRCRAYTKERITKEKIEEILGLVDDDEFSSVLTALNVGNVELAINILNTCIDKGKDINNFANDLIWHIRDVLIAKNVAKPIETLNITKSNFEKLKKESESIAKETLIFFIEALSKALNVMRYDENRRVILETTFIRLANPETNFFESAVMARIKKLEEEKKNMSYVVVGDRENDSIKDADTKNNEEVDKTNKKISEIKVSKLTFDEMNLIEENWQSIKAALGIRFKSIIKDAKLMPGTKNESGVVQVLLSNIDYHILKDGNYIDMIQEKLSLSTKEILKKDVKYILINANDTEYDKNVTYKLEEVYDKIVGMEIGIEDDK